MSDIGDGASSASVSDSSESGAEAMESGAEGLETAETELCSNEAQQELYDPGYDHSEYETELMDFSYELKEGKTYIPESGEPKYNENGEQVDDTPIYRAEEFYVDYNDPDYVQEGLHSVEWPGNDGFEGDPVETELPENTIIARYGSEHGRYGTDVGTKPTELSLPYDTSSQEYHEYRVCGKVSCKSGTVSSAFNAPGEGRQGGGKQYVFGKSFAEMVSDGTLQKIK